ncbi:KDGP aldolase family protein [Paenibacillus sp. Marseille-Q4541]|uniref:2-dehydro-3-deoxy-phosphogluconate aldolase n=1 Tax=Paenibacillus sp. Marseille-Q4541 TaxID=2831522 RepID=UPI001BA43F98|nr:KDGP aldolase family protein [Paenibacillus sp. Marseille-Q4541]
MTTMDNRLYKGRAALNVLAGSVENAKNIFEAAEGHVVIGVLSKNYPDANAAVTAMKLHGEVCEDAVSIGLGAGDPKQSEVVSEIAREYAGTHINQVFTGVGATRSSLNGEESWINSLVSPCGKPGYVNLSTGPLSSSTPEKAIVPVEAAIALVSDMGGNALKYFPMNGLDTKEEFIAVANACAKAGFALEPTGGIDKENFREIVQIALKAGVPVVIPHVYSSIIDKTTGETIIQDVQELTEILKYEVDAHGKG